MRSHWLIFVLVGLLLLVAGCQSNADIQKQKIITYCEANTPTLNLNKFYDVSISKESIFPMLSDRVCFGEYLNCTNYKSIACRKSISVGENVNYYYCNIIIPIPTSTSSDGTILELSGAYRLDFIVKKGETTPYNDNPPYGSVVYWKEYDVLNYSCENANTISD
jgi:hypothetical protein